MIPIYDENPTTRRPYVTIGLIAICVLVYVWQISLDPRTGQLVTQLYGFVPALLFEPEGLFTGDADLRVWSTLITSMFLHGGPMHLAGNMLYLWIFGNNIEDVTGHGRYLIFYLLCGLAAAMAQGLPDMSSTIPMIGASGAISGVLGAYLLLFPKAQVRVVIPIGFFLMRTLPAGWLLGIWIAFQVVSGFAAAGSGQGGVAWWAHVGGFVAGMVLIHLFRQKTSVPTAAGSIGRSVGSARATGRSRIPPSGRSDQAGDQILAAKRRQRDVRKKDEDKINKPDPPTVQRRRDP